MQRKIVTQIGSLPYESPGEAVAYSLRHDIPFLPELPRRGDLILEYIKTPGRLSCLEEFKKHRYETVKIQCVGPATLVYNGYAREQALRKAREHIARVVDGLNAEEVILFLDEPAMGKFSFNHERLWETVFSTFDVARGVHTCAYYDFGEMLDAGIDILSFDASKYGITKYSRRSKRIAWGIKRKEDAKDFRAGDLLTLPCGLGGGSSIEDCESSLDMLQRAARELP